MSGVNFNDTDDQPLVKADIVATGSAGVAAENAGTATTLARSDHQHAIAKEVTIALSGNLSNGAGQFEFRVPIPTAGFTLVEVYMSLQTAAGTSIDVQVEEFNEAGVSQGTVLSSAEAMGTALFKAVTGLVGARTTPGKNAFYKLNLTNMAGSPAANLSVQMRFWMLSDVKAV